MSQSKKTTVLGKTPDLQALLSAMSDARRNTEALAQQSSGDVTLEDGTDTGEPSALVSQQQAAADRDDAEKHAQADDPFTDQSGDSFQQGAFGWAKEAKTAASAAAGISGFIESGNDESDLPTALNHTDETWVVANDTQGRANALYRSDGSSWSYIGVSLTTQAYTDDASNRMTGQLPDAQVSESSVTQHAPPALEVGVSDAVATRDNTSAAAGSSTRAERAQAVQDAIDRAISEGKGVVIVRGKHGPTNGGYDASNVSFDDGIRMVTPFQDVGGVNVRAYGAIGDSSADDYHSFQAAADIAFSRQQNFGAERAFIYVPDSRFGIYLISQEWFIRGKSVTVAGDGMYSTVISQHPTFDPTTDANLVRVGNGPGAIPEEVSSFYMRDLNISGKGKEIRGLQYYGWYSAFFHNIRAVGGDPNQDGIGRKCAGLHIRSGKNLHVNQCQFATQGGFGILVDDLGLSGNQHNTNFVVTQCLITENNEGGLHINNGSFAPKISNNHFAVNGGDPVFADDGGVQVLIQSGFGFDFHHNTVGPGEYGLVSRPGKRVAEHVTNNRFANCNRQGLVGDGGNYAHRCYRDNTFVQCGSDHVEGGTIDADYRTSDHVADLHVDKSFGGTNHFQGNLHIRDSQADETTDRYAALISADALPSGNDVIAGGPDAYTLIAGNNPFDNGYLARDGSVVGRGQAHVMDAEGVIHENVAEEAAGAGNTPAADNYRVGDFVLNSDDGALYALLRGKNWKRLLTEPRTGFSTWDDLTHATGYSGFIDLAADLDTPCYVLISRMDGNANNQRFHGHIYIGRRFTSSVSAFSRCTVWWSQNSDGKDNNLGVKLQRDLEGGGRAVQARPVELDHDGAKWAAVEFTYSDFGGIISQAAVQAQSAGGYDTSIIDLVGAGGVSNVVGWRNATNETHLGEESSHMIGRFHEGYGDPSAIDLSTQNGDFDGQVMMNDGTTGAKGPHWWDEAVGNWKQMDDWTQTI